ncbi:hypothetical protein [Rhizorhabdus sp.]|uniref:hypothetical protein n=1 Tax=Rhizorhabdus sp. TaxID=1968843 RepID=UPI0035B25195
MIAYLRKRFSERSTWAALGVAASSAVGSLASVSGVPPQLINGMAAFAAACGFVVALLPTSGGGE